MTKTTLNWGLLSTARINRSIIPPLRVSPRNRLVAVASRKLESAEAYAREWQIGRAIGSYEALLADPEIDVIYNPLPNHLHAEWTIRAMAAGKHVLCEKPISLTPAELDAIEAASIKYNRVVAEAFMYRHHPQTLMVKEMVESGKIGQLQAVRGAFTFNMSSKTNIRLVPEYGGGSIWDVGCYPISYARFIIGCEPLQVFGQQVTGPSGVDMSFYGQMKFPGDIYAQFDSSFRTQYRMHLEIVGSEGAISMPHPYKPTPDEKIILTRGGETEEIPVPSTELYIGEVEDMADAILLGKTPRVSMAESRGNIAVMVALLESARKGQTVNL